MRPMRFPIVTIVIAAISLATLSAAGRTAAQDATPASGRIVPAPEECRVAPPPADKLQALSGTPAPVTGTVPAIERGTPAPFSLPPGSPADPATVAGVTATIRELVACLNAGDNLRRLGLYSDAFISRQFGRRPINGRAYDALATPHPLPPDKQRAIRAIADVRVLADGRVGALVVLEDPRRPHPELRRYYILVKVGDRWLIDEETPVSEQGAAG